MIVVSEYISNLRRMVLTPYNDSWRALRKFLHSQLHDKFASSYEPVQDQEAKAMALSMLEDPDNFGEHLQLFSSNVSRAVSSAIAPFDLSRFCRSFSKSRTTVEPET